MINDKKHYHLWLQNNYITIHADIITEEELLTLKNLLIENVRQRSDMPNRKGLFLKDIYEIIKNYPKVGIAYDLSHAYINREPMEEIIKYKDRIKVFHIQDTIGKQDKHLPVGKGEINYKKFFEILSEINFRGILIIEK